MDSLLRRRDGRDLRRGAQRVRSGPVRGRQLEQDDGGRRALRGYLQQRSLPVLKHNPVPEQEGSLRGENKGGHIGDQPAFAKFDGQLGDADYYDKGSKYFLDLFLAENKNKERQIYNHATCATDSKNVEVMFNSRKDIIGGWSCRCGSCVAGRGAEGADGAMA